MGLIRSYGLFWQKDRVFWGKPGTSGRLLGGPSRGYEGKSEPIDFRDQRGIYVLYDHFTPVYVGQAGGGAADRLFKRLHHHKNNIGDRWNRFSWFGTRGVKEGGELEPEQDEAHAPIPTVLNHMEGILIAAMEPRLNYQGARWGDAGVQYFQKKDDRLDDSLPETVQSLKALVENLQFRVWNLDVPRKGVEPDKPEGGGEETPPTAFEF